MLSIVEVVKRKRYTKKGCRDLDQVYKYDIRRQNAPEDSRFAAWLFTGVLDRALDDPVVADRTCVPRLLAALILTPVRFEVVVATRRKRLSARE
eukprot:5656868-Amphidinium_carterae.1